MVEYSKKSGVNEFAECSGDFDWEVLGQQKRRMPREGAAAVLLPRPLRMV